MLEIELKLAILAKPEVKKFLALDFIHCLKSRCHRLHTIYFDTPQLDLQRSGSALRIRQQGQSFVQTLKVSVASPEDGLQYFQEYEARVENFSPDLSVIPDSSLRLHWEKQLQAKVVQAIFSTDFTRRTWCYPDLTGRVVEIALDQGWIKSRGRKQAIGEIELELKQGDKVSLLHDLARFIGQAVNVTPLNASKAQRGYALAELTR